MLPGHFVQPYRNEKVLYQTRTKLRFRCLPIEGTFTKPIRVSTATQGRDGNGLEDQVAALEKYGCQEIVKEAFTGKTMERPKFLRLLEALQEGDTLVVCKLRQNRH